VRIEQTGARTWQAVWQDGTATLTLPEPEDPPEREWAESHCDLDDAPFAVSGAPTAHLLAQLIAPAPTAWRATIVAMQTLAQHGVAEAMPSIHRLLCDPGQRYQVHSVAAWCLGRARYRPARDDLQTWQASPEINTALRAGWAVARMQGEDSR
jgi:hypothetical protein